MIVSHRNRFIFVKARKTAGTSIEIALSEHCGSSDLITSIASDDEANRRSLGFPGPQNHAKSLFIHSPRDLAGALRHRRRRRYVNHTPASSIKALVGDETWDSYFKFTFVRNPFDRAISLYWWRTRGESPRPSMLEYFDRTDDIHLTDWPLYTIRDQIVVDHVARFERMGEELESIGERLGLSLSLPTKKAKGGHRSDRSHYRDVIPPALRARIEEVCRHEMDAFGYSW